MGWWCGTRLGGQARDNAGMIRLDTYRGLLEYRHTLACWCRSCQRWANVDIARLVADGRGDESFIGRRVVCRVCGGEGQAQLRPPTIGGGYNGHGGNG